MMRQCRIYMILSKQRDSCRIIKCKRNRHAVPSFNNLNILGQYKNNATSPGQNELVKTPNFIEK